MGRGRPRYSSRLTRAIIAAVRHVLALLALLTLLLQGGLPSLASDVSAACGQGSAGPHTSFVKGAIGDTCCSAGRVGEEGSGTGEGACSDPCCLFCPCCKVAPAGNPTPGVVAVVADDRPVGEVVVSDETLHLSLPAIPLVPPPRV